jgi:hypothetical protein
MQGEGLGRDHADRLMWEGFVQVARERLRKFCEEVYREGQVDAYLRVHQTWCEPIGAHDEEHCPRIAYLRAGGTT